MYWCNPFPYQLQEVNSDDGFCQLVCSSEYEFLLECGITKPVTKMNLADKDKVVSAVCLHYAVLGSLAELEQVKRGLQTVRFTLLMECHPYQFKQLFLYSKKPVTADFMQDLFKVEYSDPGSNNRVKEEAIVMNWVSYLQDLEGVYLQQKKTTCQ